MKPQSAGPTIRWLAYATLICGATVALFHPIFDHPLPYKQPAATWPEAFESVARGSPRSSHAVRMVFHAADVLQVLPNSDGTRSRQPTRLADRGTGKVGEFVGFRFCRVRSG